MADTIETLKELARQVRYATREGENTGERVGRTLVGILNLLSQCSLEELNKIFLHKSKPDETPFLLKLFGGTVIGEAIDSLTAGKGIIADILGVCSCHVWKSVTRLSCCA